jgi:hypothetical protein
MMRPLVVASMVLALAACGGSEPGAGGEAAGFLPADTALYAEIDSSLDSSQWDDVNALLDRFPGSDRLVAELREGLSEEGVTREQLEAAFGDIVALAVLDAADADETLVGLTQPDDADALRAAFDEQDLVYREVSGWTAFAQSEAVLDRLDGDGDSLADAGRFVDAWGELPDEALAKVFFDGGAVEEAAGQLGAGAAIPTGSRFETAVFALRAEDDGVRVEAKAFGQEQPLPDLTFAEEVPAGAILFANFHGSQGGLSGIAELRSNPLFGAAIEEAERQLGVTLEDVARLFAGETALYVRPGVLIPEVTLVLEAEDEAQARRTLDRLGEGVGGLFGAGTTRPRTIAGVEATELNLGMFSLYYAVFDGRAVVTTLPTGIEDLREDGDRLADDDAFADAREAAGGGDVVLFVDLDETVGLVERLAQLGEEEIPPDVRANLEPLRAFVVTAEGGDGETSIDAFLSLD